MCDGVEGQSEGEQTDGELRGVSTHGLLPPERTVSAVSAPDQETRHLKPLTPGPSTK